MAETTIDTELAEEFSGSYTSESEAPRVGRGSSLTAPGQALGRRKEAVARVRLIPGSGEWKINGRTGVAFVSHIGAAEKKRAAPTGLA